MMTTPSTDPGDDRGQVQPPHRWDDKRDQHRQRHDAQPANPVERTGGQVDGDEPEHDPARAFLRVGRLKIHQPERPDLVRSLEERDGDRRERLPPEPGTGPPQPEFLGEVSCEWRAVGKKTFEHRQRKSRGFTACHVRLSFSCGQIPPERYERLLGVPRGAQAARRHPEEAFRAPAPLRRRVANCRGHESVPLQAVECGVGSAEQHAPAAGFFDFPCYLYAVGLLADAQRGQEDHQLEIGQQLARHIFTNCE